MCKGFLIIIISLIFNGLTNDVCAQKNFSRLSPELNNPIIPGLPSMRATALASIPPSLYIDRLGLICRQEWKLEKYSGVAFRFRLGSLDYVNKMEGKKY